ncbi:hypothetical protein FH972_021020 [Carpinus fangiana]|uniref:Xylanolytic transcriptional activator regulatory domain-containing protein n=1 Tax=Carpinus fangiana TaxID=176857 RepID=A0A5N6KN73_9ROSI|nr:hypothetical protein FH972_021020 [Carpinus fangiana]
MPVLCERDTDAHFESLWPSSPGVSSMAQKRRRPSPLIDIILACAMQHDSKSRVHLGARQSSPDTQILYFERSQTMLLGDALCSPDLMNVQALILMSHYLTHQGKMQKASGYFAMAMRMAMAMHLHHDPPSFLTPTAQELRRRIWWYIYTSEAIDAVANGRVWTLDVPGLDVRMMADDAETAILSCTKFGKDDGTGTTWLSYSVQMVSLYQLAVKGLVGCRDGSDENKEDAVVESLEKWAKNVPVNLRTLGTFGDDADLATPSFDETPFAVSPDKYRLKIDTSKPQWLQKQRLLLELHFRHAVMLFCRHAIESQLDRKDTGDEPSPAATKCIQHALSISRMLLQVLTETALLESQSDALHMLWNSSLTLVAFSMAFGSRAMGRHITETLQLNCEVFGQFAGMIYAAGLARSQLQQFLQQMGLVTVEASPNETSNSSTAQQFSSAMKQMTSVAPFNIEESPKAAFHRQSITDATAHWASQFGPTQGMPLDDDMSGSHLPPLSVPGNGMAWSMGSSMPAYSNSESYRPWTSDGTDGIDMDNFMFDLSSVTSVGQSTSGHV